MCHWLGSNSILISVSVHFKQIFDGVLFDFSSLLIPSIDLIRESEWFLFLAKVGGQ